MNELNQLADTASLLLENDALKKQVQRLQNRLNRLERIGKLAFWEGDMTHYDNRYASDEWYRITGLNREEFPVISDEKFFSLVHPDDRHLYLYDMDSLEELVIEHRIVRPDGTIVYVDNRMEFIKDENGKLIYVNGYIQDITERKLQEAELKESKERYEFVISNISDGLFDFDLNENTIFLNEVYHKQFPQAAEKLKTDFFGWMESVHPDDLARAKEWVQSAVDDTSISVTHLPFKMLTANGKYEHVICHVAIFRNPDGSFKRLLGAYINETERIRLQEERISHQKTIAKAVIDTQEKERNFLGTQLRDSITQLLAISKLSLENTKYYPERSVEFTDKALNYLETAIREARNISQQMATPVMYDMDFASAVNALAEHYESIDFKLKLNMDINERRINQLLKLSVYRIIQEQVNYLLKDTSSRSLAVTLTTKDNQTELVMEDESGICEAGKQSDAFTNIRNRVEIFDGILSMHPLQPQGCKMKIVFPN